MCASLLIAHAVPIVVQQSILCAVSPYSHLGTHSRAHAACACCPLQNPDPKAAQYFASYISKAYAALTDEVSRQNYEKYGHPDGPQVRA